MLMLSLPWSKEIDEDAVPGDTAWIVRNGHGQEQGEGKEEGNVSRTRIRIGVKGRRRCRDDHAPCAELRVSGVLENAGAQGDPS